jgi:peptidoglycan/LPS O-acetylase OafA/YrhL
LRTVKGQDLTSADLVSGYRPWLDGVRGIAVLMVVAQHTLGDVGVDLGSVGVGAFFALSGYLITSILLDERRAHGRVSLSRFYVRRAARLIPALVVVVLVCNTLFIVQRDFDPLRGSVTALTYTTNYATILQHDFVVGYGPTWTLAVEEHFYVLWPLALLWLTRRFNLRTALAATLGVCAFAVVWRAFLAFVQAPVDLLYIGSLERSDALLYGCAAAIAIRLGWRPSAASFWLGTATTAAMPLMPFVLDSAYQDAVFTTAVLAVSAAAMIVGLDYVAPSWVRSCLSLRALVAVGVISYGLYLWHGPLMRIARGFGYDGPEWRAVVALVSIGVAWTSYRHVEAPIRAWARRRQTRPHMG